MTVELTFGAQDVRIVSADVVYEGHFELRKLTLQHRCFAGGWSQPLTRELFERGDAVGVLPYDPTDDSVVLIEQFRPGAMRGTDSPWMLELVAGVVTDISIPEEHRWIPTGMTVKYLAMAKTDITLKTVVKNVDWTMLGEIEVPVEAYDTENHLVFTAQISMRLSERKSS